MRVELAFFKGDQVLCRGVIELAPEERQYTVESAEGEMFRLSYRLEEPMCGVGVRCYKFGKMVGRVTVPMAVHTSKDWEAVKLVEGYVMCFKCSGQ